MVRRLVALAVVLAGLAALAAPASAQLPRRLAHHQHPVIALGWAGDGQSLVTGDTHGVLAVWDAANWTVRTRLHVSAPGYSSLGVSSDGAQIALGGPDGKVRLIGSKDGGKIATSAEFQSGSVHAITYEPAGTSLAAVSGVFAGRGMITVRNAADLNLIRTIEAFPGAAYAVAFSQEGTLIGVGGGRILKPGVLRVYAAADGALQAACGPWQDVVHAVAFAPGGNQVAGGGRDGCIRIFGTADGKEVSTLKGGGEVVALAYSDEGKRLAAVSAHGRIRVWDVPSKKLIAVACSPKVSTRAAAFTKDGNRVAIGSGDGSVHIFDIPSIIGWKVARERGLRPCDKPACGAPNVVVIVADDLGWGDLGCYGQQMIRTPRIDRLASEGLRLTNFYSGAPTGRASRCSLMTGLSTGHSRLRDSDKNLPLLPDDITMAEVLGAAGYSTAAIGRWALGDEGTSGLPTRQGFQHYFGPLEKPASDNYYPPFLWRGEARVNLPGNQNGEKKDYLPEVLTQDALAWLEKHKAEPFFLYVAFPEPHAVIESPELGIYANQNWPEPQKIYAAAVSRFDRDVGRIIDKLDELGLNEHTIVVVTSDNGPHKDGGFDPAFFRSAGGLRGGKGELYDGGIRVPGIIRWPHRVRSKQTSHVPASQTDLMATFAELAGAPHLPKQLDGLSLHALFFGARTLDSGDERALYFEQHVPEFRQAVRFGDWKALRTGLVGQIELYNLAEDEGETQNIAAANPDIVAEAKEWLDTSRVPSADWPVAGE